MLRDRMMKEDQGVPKTKLGDASLHPQELFKKTQASKLGNAPLHPLLHQQLSGLSSSPIFFYCFTCYVLNLERLF